MEDRYAFCNAELSLGSFLCLSVSSLLLRRATP